MIEVNLLQMGPERPQQALGCREPPGAEQGKGSVHPLRLGDRWGDREVTGSAGALQQAGLVRGSPGHRGSGCSPCEA